MDFEIPADLTVFSAQGLEKLRAKAREEYSTLFAAVSVDNVTDEQLDRLEALKAFDSAAKAQMATFNTTPDTAKADRLTALAASEEALDTTRVPADGIRTAVPASSRRSGGGYATTLSISQSPRRVVTVRSWSRKGEAALRCAVPSPTSRLATVRNDPASPRGVMTKPRATGAWSKASRWSRHRVDRP